MAPELKSASLLQNFGVGQLLQYFQDTAQYVHADNVGAPGGCKKLVQRLKDEAPQRFNEAGLATHGDESACSQSANLGVTLDGARSAARTAEKRFRRLDRFISWALARGTLSPKGMEKLVGHLTVAFMLRPRVHPSGAPSPILNAYFMSLDPWLLAPPRYPVARADLTNAVRTYSRPPVLAWAQERISKRWQETRPTARKSRTAKRLHPQDADWASAARSGRNFLANGAVHASTRETRSFAVDMISDRAQKRKVSLLEALDSDQMLCYLFGKIYFEDKDDYSGHQLTAAWLDYKLESEVHALLAHWLVAPAQDIARHGGLVFGPEFAKMVKVAAARVKMPNMMLYLFYKAVRSWCPASEFEVQAIEAGVPSAPLPPVGLPDCWQRLRASSDRFRSQRARLYRFPAVQIYLCRIAVAASSASLLLLSAISSSCGGSLTIAWSLQHLEGDVPGPRPPRRRVQCRAMPWEGMKLENPLKGSWVDPGYWQEQTFIVAQLKRFRPDQKLMWVLELCPASGKHLGYLNDKDKKGAERLVGTYIAFGEVEDSRWGTDRHQGREPDLFQ
ncbi:unnamed protein product [Prorocentrum cordatum]|uniref:Uncharacterized protein n=1 Tax=Prorocentrum cordatum TaxID=2364126 RepID=A0ABN9SKT7_9DINO|nr:unnamed protein product [Polarella glacialis]